MRGENSYCDVCGNTIFFSEINMSYNQYQCRTCGNTFTSHFGSNCLERLERGRQLHYDKLIKALDRAKKFFEEEKAEGKKREIEIARKRMNKAQQDIDDFKQEEIDRVSRFLPAGSSDELIQNCSPFGIEILNDVKLTLGRE
jgi:hypothetical protein